MSGLLDALAPALPYALVVGLAWIGWAYYWAGVGGRVDEVGERLDALAPAYEFSALPEPEPPRRDYSADRGEAPRRAAAYGLVIRWPDLYARVAQRLGDPLGGA